MNNGFVDEIKSRCNIVDVVGSYVSLKRAGNSYKGLCPFHSEKTPSFNVNESSQYYHCFGCGKSGDVISFVQDMENLDFMDACRKLADRYGIDIDKYGYRNESARNRIYEMNRDAARFFFRNLTSGPNRGYDYAVSRKLDAAAIKEFGLGYSPDDWHALGDYMKGLPGRNYTDAEMAKAGLLSFSKGHYYDKFRDRVIFPIINTRGKVIGFGGRIIGKGEPKYLNSPESDAFQKKNNLFGLNLARNHISTADQVILVEGYMDMVSLYCNGVKNVVASLGTALTENQCSLLSRYTKNVVLSYDADAAGRKAALRGIEIIQRAGMKARVLHVPDGKDPDEFIKKHGKNAFLKLVDDALPYAEYKLQAVRSRYGDDLSDTETSISFLQEAASVLESLSPVEADLYAMKISQDTGIAEGAFKNEINSIRKRRSGDPVQRQRVEDTVSQAPGRESPERDDRSDKLQRTLLALIAFDAGYIAPISRFEHVFSVPAYFNIYSTCRSISGDAANGLMDLKTVMDNLEPDESRIFQEIISTVSIRDNDRKIYEDCVKKIRTDELEKRRSEIDRRLSVADEESSIHLMKELNDINKELSEIKKKLTL